MRARALLLAATLALAGCGASDGTSVAQPPTPTVATASPSVDPTPLPPPATPTAQPTVAEPTPAPTAERTPTPGSGIGIHPPPFPALLTRTGIPVAVVGAIGDRLLVRTPCGAYAEVTDGDPIEPVDVVLDPGHGGDIDTGAVGANGLTEKEVNLRLAFATEELLEERGISVALTRTGDYLVLLSVRAEIADRLGAAALVSIHHNAPRGDPSDGPGTEVFVQSGSEESARLGGLLYEEVVSGLSVFDIEWTTAPDAGVLRVLVPEGRDAYGMIQRPETPTALVELGYIANPPEADLFATDGYIQLASIALADAIEAYLETDRPGTGFGNPPRIFTPNRAPGADVCVEPDLGG